MTKITVGDLGDMAVAGRGYFFKIITKECLMLYYADYPVNETADTYEHLFESLRMDLKIPHDERYAIYVTKPLEGVCTIGICDLLKGEALTGQTVDENDFVC